MERGRRGQHVVAMDAHILQTLLLPKIGDVKRQFVIALRPGGMRLSSEIAMLSLFLFGGRNGAEPLLDLLLVSSALA